MIVKNVEKKEHSTALFQVEIDSEAFEAAINSAFEKNKGRIIVAGFRKGKAPRKVIEGMYGADVFYEDASEILAPEAFQFGVKEAQLNNVGTPSFVDFIVDDNKSVTLTFSTDIYPQVELGQYLGLEAEYEVKEVTQDEIDKEIQSVRSRNARLVDVDRPIQNGDMIVLDFEGFVDGEAFEGGKSESFPLEIGSGSFIPGFEDQLVGMTAGQEGEINVTFPEEYDANLAGRDATFKVKIIAVRESEYPELDDEFAKDVSEFDTMQDYLDSLREKLGKERLETAERQFKAELLYLAASNISGEIPGSMVEEKIDEILRGYMGNMGMGAYATRQDFIKMLGPQAESMVEMIRPNAMVQVRTDLMLEKVAEVENIEVGQEEKDEYFKQIEEEYGEEAEKIKAMIPEEMMVRDIARRKAIEMISNSGVKTEAKPKEEAAEDK